MNQSTFFTNLCHDDTPVHNPIMAETLDYLRAGWKVIPLHAPRGPLRACSCGREECDSVGKHPLVKNGLKDASSAPEQIEKWWKQFPFANVGIITGVETGFVVLDIDPRHDGFNSLHQLESVHGLLPKSRRVATGGGGLHIYFRHPGSVVKNRTNIVPGIDFRGDGGYIVAPPSLHSSGSRYQWIDKSSLASIPEWLLSLLVTPNLKKVQLNPEGHGGIPEGARNSTLTSIGGFLHAKGILPNKLEIILQSVSETSCCPPLPTHEIRSIIQSLQNYEKDDPWQTPEELPEQTAIAESLSSKDLPHCLRPWLTDLADRMQIPLEFVAAPALISVATLVGRKIGIRPLQHDDWTVVPNLWGFLVAEPGAMKSPAIAAAMKPLEMIEKEERQKFEKICIANQEDHRRRRGEIESLRQALKVDLRSDFLDAMEDKQLRLDELEETDSKYKEIPEKRYKTNDPTVEKLALILKDNPQGVLLLRDELNGWLDSLTRSGREGSKEFYLETWNGQGSFSVDRIGRGSVHVDALCLSVFGGIQPTKLEAYIERNSSVSGDDGFLERFQVVFFPEKRSEFKLIDRNPNEEAFHLAFSSLEFIDSIKTNVSEGSYLRYTKAAQEQVDIWRVGLELRILNERLSPIFRSHIGKFRSLMPSLSLLFALLDQAPHKNLPTHVGEEPTRLALRWCQIFESHILKIYKNSVHDPYFSAKALAQKIKSLEVCDGDTIREITRKKWKALNSSELLQAAIQELTDKKWIRVQKIRGQGGPSEVIRINPSIQVRSKKGGSHV